MTAELMMFDDGSIRSNQWEPLSYVEVRDSFTSPASVPMKSSWTTEATTEFDKRIVGLGETRTDLIVFSEGHSRFTKSGARGFTNPQDALDNANKN